MEQLSAPAARRVALAAQGFADRPPTGVVDRRHLRRVLDRVGLLQIDSVNVVARSHYLPLFSRLGPYRAGLLDDMAFRPHRATRPRELFEYWAHEASLIPIEVHPLLRWRMAASTERPRRRSWALDNATYLDSVRSQVADRGPLRVADLKEPGARSGPWWGWSEGKAALEWLFLAGEVAVAERRNFERVYDLTERVLPAAVLALPTPGEDEAKRGLLLRAGRHLGVGTAADLADYYRISMPEARPRLAELVEEGTLVPVAVEGWGSPAYLHPGARLPRRVSATALLSPFDSLVWLRERTQRLFQFHLRLELYVPAAKRRWGYYVLPFLLDGGLVARVDLKADRNAGALLVRAAHAEEGEATARVATALRSHLEALAGWLGLGAVVVGQRGDLAPALARAVVAGS